MIFGIIMGGMFCPVLWVWMMDKREVDWPRDWRHGLLYFTIALAATLLLALACNAGVYLVKELV